ncbi:MAG: hypothetical protein ABID61_01515 [Candidatus Micrarchaeota archaeon]
MRRLAITAVMLSITTPPVPVLSRPLTDRLPQPQTIITTSSDIPISTPPAPGFFSPQTWKNGLCRGKAKPGNEDILYVTYDYTSQQVISQTTLPSLDIGETILGKECHADATLIVTTRNLLVLPGATDLLTSPIENRTWWPYTFNSPLVKYASIAPLKLAFVFGDGRVYIGQVLPKEKNIKWKSLGIVSTPSKISKISVNDTVLLVEFENGKKEKFNL